MGTQSALINELLGTMDAKIFSLVLQLILVGAVVMWIKDVTSRVVNYYKLKMSDFGRGTNIKVEGFLGQIHRIGFSEVEIILDEGDTLLIPVERFVKATKTILNSNRQKK